MNPPLRQPLLLLFAWLLLLPGRAGEPATDPLVDFLGKLGYQRVELTRVGRPSPESPTEANNLYLGALVDGRKQRWKLDTGCSVTCFQLAAGKRLKTLGELHRRVKDPVLGTVGGSDFVLIGELQLGKMLLANQPAQIDNLDGRQAMERADALLGIDLLRRNHAAIDFLGRSLFLRAQAPDDKQVAALDDVLRRSGWSAVPLTTDSSFRLFAEAQVKGERLRLLVDSGCELSQLDTAVAKRLGLKLDYAHLTVAGIGNRLADGYSATPARVQLAGLTLTNAPVSVADLAPWQSSEPSERMDGVLGADWLALGRGVLDCQAKRLYLTPLYEPKR